LRPCLSDPVGAKESSEKGRGEEEGIKEGRGGEGRDEVREARKGDEGRKERKKRRGRGATSVLEED